MLQHLLCVYSTIIRSQLTPAIFCVVITPNNTAKKYVTPFDGDVYPEN
jgi:hypothetical protein